jgi:fluoride ion exporter CrcB/FEX
MIYYSAAFSFLLGDLLMGLGRNVYLWVIAGLAASIPIPFISAGQRIIMYEKIPKEMLGRIFAVRNAIQYSTIPFGILLGGVLADFVFEPFMSSENLLAAFLGSLVGRGKGSGMAVMFLITGILGTVSTLIGYYSKVVRNMENKEK